MITAKALAACLIMAANTYQVPAAVMIGIMQVEGGHVGEASRNSNGSFDLGPMQVNTIWMPQLSKLWSVDQRTAALWVRDDGCVNVHVAAWILKQKIVEAGSLVGGIAHYHSATPQHGVPYASKVVAAMDKKGLITHDTPYKYYEYAQK